MSGKHISKLCRCRNVNVKRIKKSLLDHSDLKFEFLFLSFKNIVYAFNCSNPCIIDKEYEPNFISYSTCQVLDDSCHVDRRPHANSVFVRASAQVPHHPPHREDDTSPG